MIANRGLGTNAHPHSTYAIQTIEKLQPQFSSKDSRNLRFCCLLDAPNFVSNLGEKFFLEFVAGNKNINLKTVVRHDES